MQQYVWSFLFAVFLAWHSKTARTAVAHALTRTESPLVYGGGSQGIMGIVSRAVLKEGGQVTGVVPYAMVAAGGEGQNETGTAASVDLNEVGREKVRTGELSLFTPTHESLLHRSRR